MSNTFKSVVRRNQRRLLLQLLADQENGQTADAESLRGVLATLGHPTTVGEFSDLTNYLLDDAKAFIRLQRRQAGKTHLDLLTLTAKGQDLLDGTLCDAGIGEGCSDTFQV